MSTSTRYQYVDPSGAWIEDLGNEAVRLGSLEGFTEVAELGGSGASGLQIDDPLGTAGHIADDIVGHKTLIVFEDAAPVNNRRIITSYITERRYARDEEKALLGAERQIDIDLQDLNAALQFRIFHDDDADRPAETVGERLAWLVGDTAVFADNGLVIYPTAPTMDANNYNGQHEGDLIADCALAVGYNYFLYYSESASQISLFFDESNTSTAYSSTARLTNVLADKDSDTVIGAGATQTWPAGNIVLTRDPKRVVSGIYLAYAAGYVFRNLASTVTAFGRRDLSASTSNVKTAGAASDIADRMLAENSDEADTVELDVDVPPANVNDIRAGHRLEVKFSHLPGYSAAYVWCRVLRRKVSQTEETPDHYKLHLVLVPQTVVPPPIGCADPDNVDLNLLHGTVIGYTSNAAVVPAPTTPANMNDGNDATSSSRPNQLIAPAYTGTIFHTGWISDLGAAYEVACMDYLDPVGLHTIVSNIEYSTIGTSGPWTAVSFVTQGNTPTTGWRRWLFDTSVTARYWRITDNIYTPGNLPFGFSYAETFRGYTWTINGQ